MAVMSVPEPLNTPVDLRSAEGIGGLVDALNRLAADAVALYLKTKNYHWHVSGSHFRDYHLLFDEQAESILESVDILAERVRKSQWHDAALRFAREPFAAGRRRRP